MKICIAHNISASLNLRHNMNTILLSWSGSCKLGTKYIVIRWDEVSVVEREINHCEERLTAAGGRCRCWCRWRRRREYLTSDCSVAVLLSLLLQSSSPSSSSSSLSQTLVDSTSLTAKPPTSRWWSLPAVPTAPRATDFFTVSDLRLFPTLPFTLKQNNNAITCWLLTEIKQ